jgi:hypothetical protein
MWVCHVYFIEIYDKQIPTADYTFLAHSGLILGLLSSYLSLPDTKDCQTQAHL